MEKKIILKDIISSQHHSERKAILPRNINLPLNTGKIIVVTGVRRCGKTSLLYRTLNLLIESGIPVKKTCFISFDDERLMLEIEDMDLIIQSYKELYPEINLQECYWFFDEIQNIENWEKFIRRIYDMVSTNLFISGSNSKQLGSEIATSLRGRTMRYELYPLMFDEYLNFKNIDTYYFGEQNKAKLLHAFYEYLVNGGFPDAVNCDAEQRRMIIADYFQVLLFRDIVERYKVTKISALKYFIQRLLANVGKPFSVNKIYNELKSRGKSVNKDLLYEIIEYIEAVYLAFRLYKFDYSIVNREMSDKKLFCIDNGLLNTVSFQFSKDWGKLLENNTAVWLRNLYPDSCFYYSEIQECDFIIFDRDKPLYAIQVCYDITEPDTQKREIAGMEKAMKYFNIDKGLIITAEQESEIKTSNNLILVKPAYKMMIDKKL